MKRALIAGASFVTGFITACFALEHPRPRTLRQYEKHEVRGFNGR